MKVKMNGTLLLLLITTTHAITQRQRLHQLAVSNEQGIFDRMVAKLSEKEDAEQLQMEAL